jgi:DNA replication protein DnaC
MKNDFNDNKNINENIVFDNEFQSIYNKMEFSNENIFITGKAGTGKTTLLEFCNTCFNWNISY